MVLNGPTLSAVYKKILHFQRFKDNPFLEDGYGRNVFYYVPIHKLY